MASGPDPNSFGDGAKRDEATTKVPSKDPKKKDDKKEEDLAGDPCLNKLHDVVRPDAKEVVMDGTWRFSKVFVVSDATDVETLCLLAELKHLKKLRKLSITINKGGEFTVSQLFVDIQDFSNLEKLKVAWGVTYPKPHKAPKKVAVPSHLPEKLMKLDLQCFPDAELPSLLEPGKLRMLEKLYIKRGTKLTGFGKSVPEKPTECSVKVLRLKFLPMLKVEWRELRELYFPKLEFLDKYQSPQVSFCPCDGIGIWRGKSNQL
uniref:FBD domain-containing protein n=1 Tax=Brassica oleracea var. oleracea TaxID=109376 RepID=A0A0D3CSB7_BRAOL